MINTITVTATIMPMISPQFVDCGEFGVGVGVGVGAGVDVGGAVSESAKLVVTVWSATIFVKA